MPTRPTSVQLVGVSRTFGATVALADLSIEFAAGRIHALVGQNGAGKSTCLGIVAGRIAATTGHVQVGEHTYGQSADPLAGLAAGIAAIYQELTIVPALSAWENVYLGRLRSHVGTIDRRAMRTGFQGLCDRFELTIDPDAPAGDLSLADQQMIEIMRSLTSQNKVLLLDEPTAALSPRERLALFRVMRELRDEGVCVIFVSHYLDEVLENSDEITVFRDGKLVTRRPAADWNEDQLVTAMLGQERSALSRIQSHRGETIDRSHEAALRVQGLHVGKVQNLDLYLRPGEIVGIAGMAGSGRSTLLRALAGLQPARGGTLHLAGVEHPLPHNPRAAWRQRISLIPEDRKIAGLALGLSGEDNIVLGDLSAIARAGVVDTSRMRRRVRELADKVGLPQDMLTRGAGHLSGGNQQKLLFARWSLRRPTVLLADEATRGIDIGAKGQVLAMMREMAAEGTAVLFVSSDLEEVIAASDRIYVLRAGSVAAHFETTSGLDIQDLLKPAFGLGATA